MEEDHYVAPDFLHMIQMMKYYKATNNLDVDILCLGTYLRKSSKNKKTSAREVNIMKYLSEIWNFEL